MKSAKTRAGFVQKLERAKEESVGQLLLKAARLWNDDAMSRIQKTNPALRSSHTRLLPHIDIEGTKLTDLATRMGVTKQAAGEWVNELEAEGLLERIADPNDKRAKLIRLTAKGRRALLSGLALLTAMEDELAEDMGKARMKALGTTLTRLIAILEDAGQAR